MLLKAHGNKTDFYLTDKIEPQSIYNVARNFEIAAWKLSTARDANGNLYLLTNEINRKLKDRNLSFEREFGKMIGRTDLYAIALAEKSQRLDFTHDAKYRNHGVFTVLIKKHVFLFQNKMPCEANIHALPEHLFISYSYGLILILIPLCRAFG